MVDEPKRSPGRPKKPATPPVDAPPHAATGPTGAPIQPQEAQRNLHATFRLAARVLRSDAELALAEFDDAGHGLVDTAREFPQAEPAIRAIVRALGPAVTAADLVEKFSRLFARSGVKKDLSQWQPPWKRQPAQESVSPGPDSPADV